MVVKGCTKKFVVASLIIWWRLYYGFAQPGFLSINCGGKTNRTETDTNITWVTDHGFIDVGYSKDIGNSTLTPFYFQSQRVFPKTLKKSCYQLPLKPNVPHLLRLWFVKANFSEGESLNFKYSIETLGMLSLRNPPTQSIKTISSEKILVSSSKVLYVCLIRSSAVDPFISAIELRPLRPGMYTESQLGTMLSLDSRYYAHGDDQSFPVRYPQDPFDRRWIRLPPPSGDHRYVSSSKSISLKETRDRPPSVVLQSLITIDQGLSLQLLSNASPTCKSLLLLYFAELELKNASDSRSFVIYINYGQFPVRNITMVSNHSAMEFGLLYGSRIEQVTLEPLEPALKFKHGPIINALEHYCLVHTERATFPDDVRALSAVKQRFNLSNWVSDPCFVVPWEGIQCNQNTKIIRIVELSLDNKQMAGVLPDISNLTQLERLHLRNNNFSGVIPDWISKLRKLKELHLRNNNFSGVIPDWISNLRNLKELLLDNNQLRGELPDLSRLTKLKKLHLQNNSLDGEVPRNLSKLQNLKELFIQNNGFSGSIPRQLLHKKSLNFTYGGNPQLIIPSSNSLSKGQKIVIVGGAVLFASAVLLGIILCRRKFKKKGTISSKKSVTNKESIHAHKQDYSMVLVPTPTNSRSFTLDEMQKATENFTQKIGQGGFGSVFLGKLEDGKQIAVKVLSSFSKQGVVEFLNEIDLLSKVNHKNLVSFLGYCNESRELMLVYGYMPRGSLRDHLYGPKAGEYTNLDWKTRLKIVLDAAKGLEYLHVGCIPKIIHRDVKTANILLDDNLNGKLSDFGLSRVTVDGEASHITTTVKGTAGYLDPEYFITQMLTEKSDLYSFGVVLLEIICGRRPIDAKLSEDEINIIRWVTPYLEVIEDPDKIKEIVDKRLDNDYSTESIIHVGRLALRCVAAEPSSRPTVSEIVVEIKQVIKYENDRAATSTEVSENTFMEDLQDSEVSIPESNGPKEVVSSENSANFTYDSRLV